MRKENAKRNDSTLKFLYEEESSIKNKLLPLQNDLAHIQSLIEKRKKILNDEILSSRDNSTKARMWYSVLKALRNQQKKYEELKADSPGLTNKDLYEDLIAVDLNINQATFRGYLSQFKTENKIEKKGGRQTWTLVDN